MQTWRTRSSAVSFAGRSHQRSHGVPFMWSRWTSSRQDTSHYCWCIEGLKRMTGPLETRFSKYLKYRVTPQATIGIAPTELYLEKCWREEKYSESENGWWSNLAPSCQPPPPKPSADWKQVDWPGYSPEVNMIKRSVATLAYHTVGARPTRKPEFIRHHNYSDYDGTGFYYKPVARSFSNTNSCHHSVHIYNLQPSDTRVALPNPIQPVIQTYAGAALQPRSLHWPSKFPLLEPHSYLHQSPKLNSVELLSAEPHSQSPFH